MPTPIYNAGQGLLEKTPKLVEFAQALKNATHEILEAAKKRAEEEVIKRQGQERK